MPPSMIFGDAMHRVLTIPELLDLIFSFVDRNSNALNACVSKQWSEVALSTLWADVHDLHRLLSLLVPLRRRRDSYELVRIPQSSDWERFDKYAWRVRRLHYNKNDKNHKALHHSVFDELGRTRLRLNILPSLNTLDWVTSSLEDLALSVLFMHDRVKRFVVWLPLDEDRHAPLSYFHDVLARMPKLTHLDLRMSIPVRFVEKDVCELFRGLPKLQEVVLPNFHLSTRILTELSLLPHIGVIQFEYGAEQGVGDAKDVQVVTPALSEGAFPALWDLSLTATLVDMTRLLTMSFAPTNLTSLYVDCPTIQNASDVHHFLVTVSDNCQLLKALYLELLWIDLPTIYSIRDDNVTFDTLRPLLACPNLTEFTLTHDHPVDVTQENIEELAAKWPSLETLVLACEPIELYSPTLTLRALLPFARHCPNLRNLGLFVNASAADLPTIYDLKRFKQLTKLSMGVSSIVDSGAVALFLSQLAPLELVVECGVTWHNELDAMDVADSAALVTEVSRRCEQWSEVGRLLPLLTRLRMQERDRTRALQDEVDDLRIRNRILMERANLSADGTCVLV